MKCTYCRKKIWFWQKVQSIDVHYNPRHYHFMCLFHKLWCELDDFASLEMPDKSGEVVYYALCRLIKSI